MTNRMDHDFWANLEKWRVAFPGEHGLSWRGNWLENGYCADCRYCCGPQGDDPPFPMALLPSQIDGDTPSNFYLLDANTAYLGAKGCKAETPAGCRLPPAKKPVACGLFPFVLANGRLYLYQNCPAVMYVPLERFAALAGEVAKMLAGFSLADLKHISLDLAPEILAEKYIDMHLPIFNEHGKINGGN